MAYSPRYTELLSNSDTFCADHVFDRLVDPILSSSVTIRFSGSGEPRVPLVARTNISSTISFSWGSINSFERGLPPVSLSTFTDLYPYGALEPLKSHSSHSHAGNVSRAY